MMPTSDELTMSVELNEERYFVILMAYDYQHMRREKKPKLLWVTRLSLRARATISRKHCRRWRWPGPTSLAASWTAWCG